MKGTILLATAAAALASVAVFENGALTDIAPTEASQVDASLPQLPKTVPADKGVGTVSTYAFPSVGKVTLYQPKGPPKGAVIFLSGDGGWNPGVMNMARRIAGQGAVVAGVSTPAFLKSLEGDSSKCINPNFALRALAQDIQHRAGMRSYVHPILGGYSSGATVAFATLAPISREHLARGRFNGIWSGSGGSEALVRSARIYRHTDQQAGTRMVV